MYCGAGTFAGFDFLLVLCAHKYSYLLLFVGVSAAHNKVTTVTPLLFRCLQAYAHTYANKQKANCVTYFGPALMIGHVVAVQKGLSCE